MSSLALAEVSAFARHRRRRGRFVLWGFGLGLAGAFLLAVGYGAMAIAPGEALAILAGQLGLERIVQTEMASATTRTTGKTQPIRSEAHTYEIQYLMRIP